MLLYGRLISRPAFISLILLLNVAGFFYYIYYFNKQGYLPSPFIYDKSDTFMDLFNVLYWAYDEGRYIEWGAVYPPLSFLIVRGWNFLLMGGGLGDPANMREGSLGLILSFLLIYLTLPILVLRLRQWQEFSLIQKILIYFAVVLSAPMLFSLERGNLIIFCPLILALGTSTVGTPRAFYIALLINFKPYFAILMIYYLARRNWRGFVSCAAIAGMIFLATGLAMDDNFLVFFGNLLSFSKEETLFSLREVLALPSSVSVFSYVLGHPEGAAFAAEVVTAETIFRFIAVIETIKWLVLGLSVASVFFKNTALRDGEIFAILVVAISNLGIWVGGYTFILYLALVPVLIKMQKKRVYMLYIFLLAIPLDLILILNESIGLQYSYLADESIEIFWQLGAGSFIRPGINLLFLLTLTYEFAFKVKKPKAECFLEKHPASSPRAF